MPLSAIYYFRHSIRDRAAEVTEADNTWNESWSWTTPPAKHKQERTISFTELQSLSYAIEHFPPSTPKKVAPNCRLRQTKIRSQRLSTLRDKQSWRERDLRPVTTTVNSLSVGIQNAIPAVTDFQSPFYSGFCDTTAFLPVILLPPVSQCCGRNLLIKSRPSHSRVYTTQGTEIAAIFTGECHSETCKSRHHYSFFEKPGVAGFERYYYRLDRPYFQLTSKSVFFQLSI